MNKNAGMLDLFLFMIFAFAILLISGVFLYLGAKVNTELHNKLDGMDIGAKNVSQVIDNSIGKVNTAYTNLYWISIFLIVGMVISIFIGSYMVTTKPIFFIPYFFVLIIAIVTSVIMSNSYATVIQDPTLASSFSGFIGTNFIMNYLPVWITVIGFVGAIIMFSRMGSGSNQYVYTGG